MNDSTWNLKRKTISYVLIQGIHSMVFSLHLFFSICTHICITFNKQKITLIAWMINSNKWQILWNGDGREEKWATEIREILIRWKKGRSYYFTIQANLNSWISEYIFFLHLFVVVWIFRKWNCKKHKRKKGTASKNLHIDVIWARTLT